MGRMSVRSNNRCTYRLKRSAEERLYWEIGRHRSRDVHVDSNVRSAFLSSRTTVGEVARFGSLRKKTTEHDAKLRAALEHVVQVVNDLVSSQHIGRSSGVLHCSCRYREVIEFCTDPTEQSILRKCRTIDYGTGEQMVRLRNVVQYAGRELEKTIK